MYTLCMRASLARKALFLVISIFLLHKGADMFYWYARIAWFDMFMHFLGGIFLALIGGSLGFLFLKNTSKTTFFLSILFFVLVIGLGWELFEFSIQEIIKI